MPEPILHNNPDRLIEVNKEIEQFGCKVLAQYAVLGPYDFVSIVQTVKQHGSGPHVINARSLTLTPTGVLVLNIRLSGHV
jgi:uncharacterized protein with GYD domain